MPQDPSVCPVLMDHQDIPVKMEMPVDQDVVETRAPTVTQVREELPVKMESRDLQVWMELMEKRDRSGNKDIKDRVDHVVFQENQVKPDHVVMLVRTEAREHQDHQEESDNQEETEKTELKEKREAEENEVTREAKETKERSEQKETEDDQVFSDPTENKERRETRDHKDPLVSTVHRE